MKAILCSAVLLALLSTTSCKRDDNNGGNLSNNTGALLQNSWTIKQSPTKVSVPTTVYMATIVQNTGGQLIGSEVKGAQSHTLTLTFNGASLPTMQGYYKIVAANPGTDEVAIATNCNNCGDSYTATGYDEVYAKVSILNQKASVTVVPFWAKSSPSSMDSVQIYGNLLQP